jgi:hypothetical protein
VPRGLNRFQKSGQATLLRSVAICSSRILIACLVCASMPQPCAAIACPVSLFDGTVDQDGAGLSFRNVGKLPIQQLVFDCAITKGSTVHRSTCHEETGLFFPGTDYTSSFAFPHRAGPIVVSLAEARLAGGSMWLSKRDQRCQPLRLVRKKKPGR